MPQNADISSAALTPICLCCFGRGGSSIGWNLLGSSANVLMSGKEWHISAFQGPISAALHRTYLITHRRGIKLASPSLQRSSRSLQSLMKKRILADVPEEEWNAKPNARYIVLKVMGYHIDLLPFIQSAFGGMRVVVMSRGPEAQIESLLRSGHSLKSACRWYSDILHRMELAASLDGAVHFRFEDMLADPVGQTRLLYEKLDLDPPSGGVYRLKKKAYGEKRGPETDVSVGRIVRIAEEDLPSHLDQDANKKALARLQESQKEFIANNVLNLSFLETGLAAC